MKNLIKLLLLVALTSANSSTFSQNLTNEGTEFYVAFPEVYDNANAVFEINISSRVNAAGTVEITGTGFSQAYNVVPGVVTTVTLIGADADIIINETVIERAIHVTSDNPVTVYASTFHNARSEASICLPVTAFSSNYMVTTYPNMLKGGIWYQSEFIVVAGNMPCDVTIIPSCVTEAGIPAGTPISVHLEPNEVYQVQAQGGAANDLTGTTVSADNGTDEFAVYNGHIWAYLTNCGNQNADPLFEQAYPIESWGSEYILTITLEQDDNAYRVVAKENGTTFTVNGVATGPVLNVGDVFDGNFSDLDEAIMIESNKPCAVTQTMTTGVCSGNGDPSMIVLNSNEQMYLDTVTFYAASGGSSLVNYVNVVTRSSDTATMKFNAVPLTNWTEFTYDTEYSYKLFATGVGSHTLTTTGCGFLAYAYGMGNPESYFYAAGARVNAVEDSLSFTNINTSLAGLCDLDSIQFTPFTSGGNVISYNWDFGDGDSSVEQNPLHTYAASGTYTVELIVEYLCFTDTIVEDITVFDSPILTPTVTDVSCYDYGNGSVTTSIINGTPAYTYEWSNGSTNPDIVQLDGDDYWVVVTDQNGCQDSVFITVAEPAAINIGLLPAGPYSPADGPQSLTATPGGGVWSADCGACINPVTGVFDPLVAGDGTWQICYTVTVGGCDTVKCINILVSSTCALQAFGNDPTCFGFSDGSFTVNTSGGVGALTYILTDDQGTQVNTGNSNTANNLNSGWYYINVTDDVCAFLDSIFIGEPNQMEFGVTIVNPLCNGYLTGEVSVDTVFNYTGDYDEIAYFWNPGAPGGNGVGANVFSNAGAGSYTLLINDENGCSETVDFTITEPSAMSFTEIGSESAYCRQFGYQSGNGVIFAAANGGTPDYTYEWFNVYTLQTSNNTTWGGRNPSLYKMTVTDANGCTLEGFVTLDSLNPIAAFDPTSPQFLVQGVCEGTAVVDVHFVNQSENFANPNNPQADTTFFWHFGLPNENWVLSESYFEEFDRSYLDSGTYSVCLVALNKNGCSDTTCKEILVFEKPNLILPNVFTPGEDDAVNNTFYFPNQGINELQAVIVNRWGRTVFEFTDINQSWDGKDKSGSDCPAGVYFYTYNARATNGTEYEGQGNIHLIRK